MLDNKRKQREVSGKKSLPNFVGPQRDVSKQTASKRPKLSNEGIHSVQTLTEREVENPTIIQGALTLQALHKDVYPLILSYLLGGMSLSDIKDIMCFGGTCKRLYAVTKTYRESLKLDDAKIENLKKKILECITIPLSGGMGAFKEAVITGQFFPDLRSFTIEQIKRNFKITHVGVPGNTQRVVIKQLDINRATQWGKNLYFSYKGEFFKGKESCFLKIFKILIFEPSNNKLTITKDSFRLFENVLAENQAHHDMSALNNFSGFLRNLKGLKKSEGGKVNQIVEMIQKTGVIKFCQ